MSRLFDPTPHCTQCAGRGTVAAMRESGPTEVPCPTCTPRSKRTPGTRRTDPKTSRRAELDAYPRAGSWQQRALEAFIEAGEKGLTDYELAIALNRPNMRGSVAKYRLALVTGGWVTDSQHTRQTDTGSKAIVWELSPQGRKAVARGYRRAG